MSAIRYELKHEKLLHEIPFVDNKYEFFNLNGKKDFVVFLKINNLKKRDIKKWLKTMDI